ncbi:MAG: hypothetical protein QM579_02460, partial [Desulfovibrio sp.]|uniref:hypothetical protein n=1 Tax=Desulfovibrio sp. TaxID=885 RepID=UPI0039E21D83
MNSEYPVFIYLSDIAFVAGSMQGKRNHSLLDVVVLRTVLKPTSGKASHFCLSGGHISFVSF